MKNWENITKKKRYECLIVLLIAMSFGFADSQTGWKRTWTQIPDTQVKKIFQDLRNTNQFWALTSNALYLMDEEHKPRLMFHKFVRWLYQNPKNPQEIYLTTDDGVFLGINGEQWRSLLVEHDCLTVTRTESKLFAGTKHGLMIRPDKDSRWTNAQGKLGKTPVYHLASYGQVVYVATPNSLYRYDAASDEYKLIFTSGIARDAEVSEESSEEDPTQVIPEIIDLDLKGAEGIYVTSRKGIYYSPNSGENWTQVSDKGILTESVLALSVDPNTNALWAASKDGTYQLREDRWVKLYKGLPTNLVNDINVDELGNVYAATNRGFFIFSEQKMHAHTTGQPQSSKLFNDYHDVEDYFKNEPTVREVQAMAIEYADVHPDKIKRWQRQSRLKAFVPSLSTGIDRSATDLMHWDTGPNPDTLSKGKDFIDWDVNLSWDLGDMVWSSDQTSIDSRSKLMVELREEVLDQVTRIYFERRRVQLSLLSDDDTASIMDEQMRLAELTAIIDGYTGGKFSKRLVGKS